MVISVYKDAAELGKNAAALAVSRIREAIDTREGARVVLATGSSQFKTLAALLEHEIDWGKVEIFHLDEYIGLPVTHKASFRKYLHERFIDHITCKKFYSIDTDGDIAELTGMLGRAISSKPVDVGFIGIGENGHIAFNDPPADFDTKEPYIVVKLDERCRMQQVGEGWFGSVKEVPVKAVSMSVWQIMQCRSIISAVPHKVKAEAVRYTLTNRINNMIPATILKQHQDFNLFLDHDSASGVIEI